MTLIDIQESKCTKCYSCIRICPVRAIKADSNSDVPKIIHDRCIGCGHCVTICPAETIVYHDSREETKALLQSGQKVAAIVAPSLSGEFNDVTDHRKFVEMIRRLGFTYVNEVSFGVDLIAHQYADLFKNNKGKYYITSNCPAVFLYIEKFHPGLVDNLAPIVSPMIASAKVVHKKYGMETKVVYIGPCIATKKEASRYNGTDGQVDSVLTFKELRQLFNEFNIKESRLEFSDFDTPLGNKGSLYPISNGFIQAADINEDLLSGTVITTEGPENMLEAVREFELHPEIINRHFNLFYDEGCLMGPGTSKNGMRFLRRTLVVEYSNKRLLKFDKTEWAKHLKYYQSLELNTSFHPDDQRKARPSENKINKIMQLLGKERQSENLGCGSCGYETCHEFATAVAKGLINIDMCVTYSLRNRIEHIQTLKQTNEKLAKTQQALKASEKTARQEQLHAQQAMEMMETMLHKLPSSVVIIDENLRVLQANESFIKRLGAEAEEINDVIPGLVGADIKTLLPYNIYNLFSYVILNGEDIQNRDIHLNDQLYNLSVFSIQKNKFAGAVIRDMQSPEIRKEEVIKRVSDVIDKNLDMVQKIGFLLGEGAAETEQMLNSIIEFYKSGKK
jgi:Na+-translocating ferredoxin:NAD+ oxidoreductase RNF subunit RnfB